MASEPFIGQIQTFGFNFPPRGWATCSGQILAISTNTALFSLLGTYYGGNGQTTFALPNLNGRVPIHQGTGPGLSSYQLGQAGGTEAVTLNIAQIPAHTHSFVPTNAGVTSVQTRSTAAQAASGSLLARAIDANTSGDAIPQIYVPAGTAGTQVPMGGLSVAGTNTVLGSSQPHSNMQPYLGLNTCIALEGIYPSRN